MHTEIVTVISSISNRPLVFTGNLIKTPNLTNMAIKKFGNKQVG